MGGHHRHQLFVICKINGRYRTLSVLHHQWLYGHTALERCLGLLEIFQAVENRALIQAELLSAQRREDKFWDTEIQEVDEYVPFPCISTCHMLGASIDLTSGYDHHVSIERFNLDYDGGHNNKGITIIDITELHHVRYCFVVFYGMASDSKVPLMTPLRASTYLWAYYDKEYYDKKWKEDHDRSVELAERLEMWDLVETSALCDTWPSGAWRDKGRRFKRIRLVQDETHAPAIGRTSRGIPTLRDLALDTLIQSPCKQSEAYLRWMSEVELPADFIPTLKSKLYDNPGLLGSSPVALQLLCRALEGDSNVDLSPFYTLSSESLRTVVTKLQETGNVTTLNLSNNPNVTEADVGMILQTAPALAHLYLLETPQLSIKSILSLFKNPAVALCDLYHSDLFRRPLLQGQRMYENNDTLQFPTSADRNNPVVQLIYVNVSNIDLKFVRHDDGGLDWKRLRCYWKSFRVLPLDDAFLPPAKIVTGLAHLTSFLLSTDHPFNGTAASKNFAMASSSINGSGLQVGPLLSTLYTRRQRSSHDEMRDPKLGEWTIVVLQEKVSRHVSPGDSGAGQKLRYAFVTPVPDLFSAIAESQPLHKEFLVTDMTSFLEHVIKGPIDKPERPKLQELREYWEQQVQDRLRAEDVDTFTVCGEREICEVLQIVCSKDPKE